MAPGETLDLELGDIFPAESTDTFTGIPIKHRYLFIIPLSSFETQVKGVGFFLTESNKKFSHTAFKGTTPLEMITRRWGGDREFEQLRAKLSKAKT